MPDIFLSYGSSDVEVMRHVRSYLRNSGFEVWTYDELSYEGSRESVVERAIREVWAVIAFAVDYECCTEEVYYEADLALRLEKQVYLIGRSDYSSDSGALVCVDCNTRDILDFQPYADMDTFLEHFVDFLRRKKASECSIARN